MKRRHLAAIVFIGAASVASVVSAKPPPGGQGEQNAQTTEVQILALNDFHGQLRPPDSTSSGGRIGATPAGGAEYLASYVRDLRATNPNSLFVSAGDLIGATPLVSAIFHDEPTIEAMNLMGLDYNGVGNHEFDEGAAELTRMQEGGCHPVEGCFGGDGFEGADFEFLAANVTYKDTGETIFPPFAIHNFPGVKVAIVGMTLEGTPSIVTAAATADIDFHDEADSVNALVPLLKRQGSRRSSSCSTRAAARGRAQRDHRQLVRQPHRRRIVDVVNRFDREIDLVVTGHTNWALNCPDFAGTGIMVTGAASVGRLVTDVDLTISRATKEVVSASINNVIVRRDVTPAAADITALINKYGEIAAPTENRVIGTASAAPHPHPERSRRVVARRHHRRRPAVGDLRTDLARRQRRSSRRRVHERRRHPRRHQRRADHLRRGVQRPAVRQRAGHDGHDGRPDRRPAGAAVPGRQRDAPDLRLADLRPIEHRRGGQPRLEHPDRRRSHRRRLDLPGDGEQLPRRRWRRLQHVPQGTNRFVGEIDLDAFARYVEFLGTVNPGPQNRITLVP